MIVILMAFDSLFSLLLLKESLAELGSLPPFLPSAGGGRFVNKEAKEKKFSELNLNEAITIINWEVAGGKE